MKKNMMTNNEINPWDGMPESTTRRVSAEIIHNIFWITEIKGNYGYCVKSNKAFKQTDNIPKLKGITTIKRNSNTGTGELILILNNMEDWQLFLTLCNNLTEAALHYSDDEKMINAIEARLNRWQRLLKLENEAGMPAELQMGLLTELHCLINFIMPKVGISAAVISWVGCQKDKQDFSLSNALAEVKSYSTSKGPIINISSINQLHSEKEPLFLLTYALTRSDTGISIEDIVNDINKLLQKENYDIQHMLENKLLQYGYVPEFIVEPLFKFIIDKINLFSVTDDFPKIHPKDVKSQINNIKYSVDISKCEQFHQDLETFLQ